MRLEKMEFEITEDKGCVCVSVCVLVVATYWLPKYSFSWLSEDILACPHNFQLTFWGLKLGFKVRFRLELGLGVSWDRQG